MELYELVERLEPQLKDIAEEAKKEKQREDSERLPGVEEENERLKKRVEDLEAKVETYQRIEEEDDSVREKRERLERGVEQDKEEPLSLELDPIKNPSIFPNTVDWHDTIYELYPGYKELDHSSIDACVRGNVRKTRAAEEKIIEFITREHKKSRGKNLESIYALVKQREDIVKSFREMSYSEDSVRDHLKEYELLRRSIGWKPADAPETKGSSIFVFDKNNVFGLEMYRDNVYFLDANPYSGITFNKTGEKHNPGRIRFISHGTELCIAGMAFNNGKLYVTEREKNAVFYVNLSDFEDTIPHKDLSDLSESLQSRSYEGDPERALLKKLTEKSTIFVPLHRLEDKNSPEEFLSKPKGIAVHDDEVYVVDSGNQRVCIFSDEGKFLHSIRGEGEGKGRFMQPVGIAAYDDRIYVTDRYLKNMQVFDMGGRYLDEMFFNPSYAVASDEDMVFITNPFEHRIRGYRK
ncbi:MAG: 6-bladed beta-propeller [Candidatus Woesearchaeota archaeon]